MLHKILEFSNIHLEQLTLKVSFYITIGTSTLQGIRVSQSIDVYGNAVMYEICGKNVTRTLKKILCFVYR
jgi:hypothetical protein